MTIEAGERASDRAAGGVSGSVVNALVDLTRAATGPSGVAQLLALADDHRDFARLADPHRWSTLEETVALFNAASLVNEDGAMALHTGEALVAGADQELAAELRDAGGAATAYAALPSLLGLVDRTSSAVTLELRDDHALVRVTPRTGDHRHAHLCELTRGLLAAVPTAFGGRSSLVSESECAARGGRFCLYAVTWEPPGEVVATDGTSDEVRSRAGTEPPTLALVTDDHEDSGDTVGPEPGAEGPAEPEREPAAGDLVGRLRRELQHLDALAEATVATPVDVLADDEALLDHLGRRAHAAADAPRSLLALRLAPDAPLHVDARGMDDAFARSLAHALWGAEGGGRSQGEVDRATVEPSAVATVVDVVSPRSGRRCGGLAVFPTEGALGPAEARRLRLFAAHAAAVLDVHAVLVDAAHDTATARALLSLSEGLSRAADLAEAVQLVVDLVPGVTGCQRAAIHLRDSSLGGLVPRTGAPGPEPGGSDGGVLAVTGRPIRAAAAAGPLAPSGVAPPERGLAGDGEETEARPREPEGEADVVGTTTVPALVERLVARHEVVVVEGDVGDPTLRRLLEDDGAQAAVVAPLSAAGRLLGTLSAVFGVGTPASVYRDRTLHERLSGLADQAAASFQNFDLLDRISHMAWHDALTGLPNRRLFEDRVRQELIRSQRVGEPVCLFFVDLDDFKTVNDTLGHAAGDELVRHVADRLLGAVRDQDTVARVGGDEFAVLLPGLDDQLDIDQLAARMLEAVGRPCHLIDGEVRTTASIGIAVAPEHGHSYDELLSRADEAMYRAKSLGRNSFQTYSPTAADGSDLARLDPRALYRDLVHALGTDQFFVVYQPFVDLHTTEVLGVEALLRWRHPDYGVLEPPLFLPLAERSDAILSLDRYVLEEACAQLGRWAEAGLPAVQLALNLSTKDLEDPGYADAVAEVLARQGIDPERLELDVTERVELAEGGPASATIDRLRRLGVRFSVDGFGTANSSLRRLGAFPVSTLKIDRSFVQVLSPVGDTVELVSAIVDMADRLGLECVAEGVETPLQSRVLLQRGCTTGQGYFLCPPLTAPELEAALAVVGSPDGLEDEAGDPPPGPPGT